jgi:CotH kinase protein
VSFGYLALTALGAPTASAADEAAWMYDSDAVVEIDLGGLSAEEIDELNTNTGDYQRGTFGLRVGGVPQGPPLDVGIRLKGGLGSFQPIPGKAAFKVKFNEFVKKQTFFGLEKLTLNNMVQDPSMVHETLTYELFRSLDLPASRTGYAFVRVNDEAYGLYLNIETLDEISLPRWFVSTQHLYEAEPGLDLEPGSETEFEVDRGDDEDISDLEALIAAANDDGGDWSDGMDAVADLQQMTRMWAVERYAGHWDGYAGNPGPFGPNNYYLHSDDVGLFTMLPWGTDQTWEQAIPFDEEASGRLFNSCLADASCCEELYVDALEEVESAVATLDLDLHAAALAAMLAPYQAQELEPRREYTAEEIEEGVEGTRDLIADRPLELAEWLDTQGSSATDSCSPASEEPDPQGPGSAEELGSGEQSTLPTAEGTQAGLAGQPQIGSPVRRVLHIGPFRLRDALVTTSVDAPSAGAVTKRVTVKGRRGWQAACTDETVRNEAGVTTLRCRLTEKFRRRLRAEPLLLKVSVDFQPNAGEPTSVSRQLTAPRLSKR